MTERTLEKSIAERGYFVEIIRQRGGDILRVCKFDSLERWENDRGGIAWHYLNYSGAYWERLTAKQLEREIKREFWAWPADKIAKFNALPFNLWQDLTR